MWLISADVSNQPHARMREECQFFIFKVSRTNIQRSEFYLRNVRFIFAWALNLTMLLYFFHLNRALLGVAASWIIQIADEIYQLFKLLVWYILKKRVMISKQQNMLTMLGKRFQLLGQVWCVTSFCFHWNITSFCTSAGQWTGKNILSEWQFLRISLSIKDLMIWQGANTYYRW